MVYMCCVRTQFRAKEKKTFHRELSDSTFIEMGIRINTI